MKMCGLNSGSCSDISKRLTKRAFLGSLTTRWSIIKEEGINTTISKYRANLLSSVLCAAIIGIPFLLRDIFLPYKGSIIIVLAIPVMYVLACAVYKKQIRLTRAGRKIDFEWGIIPILKKVSFDMDEIEVRLQFIGEKNVGSLSKGFVLFLTSHNTCQERMLIAKSKTKRRILPVFRVFEEYFPTKCHDETT